MKKNKIKPDRIIQTIEENFKDILSKPNPKNLGLVSIAIAKAEQMTRKNLLTYYWDFIIIGSDIYL